MNKKRTKTYYEELTEEDLCDCAYCRNYRRQIKASYPAVSRYLESIGVDIEKPFETMPLEPEPDGTILYIGSQYAVIGDPEEFRPEKAGGISITLAESHPETRIKEKHYVIELDSIRLKWLES